MNITNQNTKRRFFNMGNDGRLLNWKMRILESGVLKRQNDQECICYCPWCGERKGKCYIKMILDDETPMLYHCFICQESGVLNSTMLEKLGITDFQDSSDINELDQIIKGSKVGYRKQIKSSNGDIECNLKDYLYDGNYNNNIIEYMKNRFHIQNINTDKMLEWCVIGNIRKYLNDVGFDSVNTRINLDNRIWFRMRNGNVIGRSINNQGERWMVIRNKQPHNGNNIYVISNLFNLSGRTIRVWMAEGVMDVIGIQNKIEQSIDESDLSETNDVFIAVMGRMYSSGFEWLIGRGLFGDSVKVNVVCDNDYTDIKNRIHQYEKCFSSIKVMQNHLDKDCGVEPDKIEFGYV